MAKNSQRPRMTGVRIKGITLASVVIAGSFVLSFLTGIWPFAIASLLWLPVLIMNITNKPLWDPEDVGF